MVCARRTAGIGVGRKRSATLATRVVADDQIARKEVYLLPIRVHEGSNGECPRRKAQKARARAALADFIERAGQDLLRNALGIAGRSRPAVGHVERMKLRMLLIYRHGDFISSGDPTSRRPRAHMDGQACW